MKILISEIPDDGLELDISEKITSESLKSDFPVFAKISIERSNSEVIIKGAIKSEIEQQCSRCLRNYTIEISTPIMAIYHPIEDINKEEQYELKEEELETGFYKNDILDIDEILIEQLLLNIPMKPLCSPDCKGLCPKCGTDLNVTSCNCNTAEIDPRLEVLKKLLERKE